VAGEARQVPGVVGVEQQPAALSVRRRPNGRDSDDQYAVYGVAPGSPLLQPTLVAGRWLTPADTDAIVVNVDFLKYEPDLQIGDRVTLAFGERVTSWRIIGVATTHLLIYGSSRPGQGVGYVSGAAFTDTVYRAASTNRIIVTTASDDAMFHAEVARAVEARFARAGIQALVQTRDDIRGQITGFVSLIVVLLLVMALIFVAVGALSLVGAMSLNVLERTKEVGVLRAIGSTHRYVATVVVFEGVCIGVLSWLPATILAVPLSRMLSDVLGLSILSWPLIHVFPPAAPLTWLVGVALLSAVASYAPARYAARINVRDALEHL
jgi:putative ABC transport system permease protein